MQPGWGSGVHLALAVPTLEETRRRLWDSAAHTQEPVGSRGGTCPAPWKQPFWGLESALAGRTREEPCSTRAPAGTHGPGHNPWQRCPTHGGPAPWAAARLAAEPLPPPEMRGTSRGRQALGRFLTAMAAQPGRRLLVVSGGNLAPGPPAPAASRLPWPCLLDLSRHTPTSRPLPQSPAPYGGRSRLGHRLVQERHPDPGVLVPLTVLPL